MQGLKSPLGILITSALKQNPGQKKPTERSLLLKLTALSTLITTVKVSNILMSSWWTDSQRTTFREILVRKSINNQSMTSCRQVLAEFNALNFSSAALILSRHKWLKAEAPAEGLESFDQFEDDVNQMLWSSVTRSQTSWAPVTCSGVRPVHTVFFIQFYLF